MSQTDAKEPEYGNESIDKDEHHKQIAQAGSDIVAFVIGKMFATPIDHGEQPDNEAGAKKEYHKTEDNQDHRSGLWKIIQPLVTFGVDESNNPNKQDFYQ